MGRTISVTDGVTGVDNLNESINPYSLYPLELAGRLPVSAFPKVPAIPVDSVS